SLIPLRNSTLSTETVTTNLLQWRCAAMAEQISIHINNLPPIRLPSVFESFGITSSFIRTRLPATVLFFGLVSTGLVSSYLLVIMVCKMVFFKYTALRSLIVSQTSERRSVDILRHRYAYLEPKVKFI